MRKMDSSSRADTAPIPGGGPLLGSGRCARIRPALVCAEGDLAV